MPRRKKTEDQLRADLASARTMLSAARHDRDRAASALIAIIDVMEKCTDGKIKEEVRRIAEAVVEGTLDAITAERAAEDERDENDAPAEHARTQADAGSAEA